MLSLYLKKAKIFFDNSSGAERRFSSVPSNHPVQVPNWVKGTLGYAYGIKDGSIVDLTPPKAAVSAPAAVTLPAADPEVAQHEVPADATDDEVEAQEITEEALEKSEDDLEDELVASTQPGARGPSAGAGAVRGGAKKSK